MLSSELLHDGLYQPASVDLPIGEYLIRLKQAFLPIHKSPQDVIADSTKVLLGSEGAVLMVGEVYLLPINILMRLRSRFTAVFNTKSSLGRLGVQTYVIGDTGQTVDFLPEEYHGRLYLVVRPLTFPIVVREGDCLTQVRFKYFADCGFKERRVSLSVNLQHANEPIGYVSIASGVEAIDLNKVSHYRLRDYFLPVELDETSILQLQQHRLYILSSNEEVSFLGCEAGEILPYHSSGEDIRIHYAGFVDPWFGSSERSCIVFEIRCFYQSLLVHGQVISEMIVEQVYPTTKRKYGVKGGNSYEGQSLRLSKYFRKES